jgi:hypothetical protein
MMNRMALALGLVAAMSGLSACKSGDSSMMITLPDAAGTTDAGMTMTPDAGGGTDAGTAATCAITLGADVPPLPSACLPRCSTATAQAAGMCADGECQQAAFEADTTPTVPFTVNGMPQQPLDCASCINIQQLSCAHDSCPDETTAVLTCNPMTDSMQCMPQQMTLQTCLQANMSAFNSCAQALAGMCFGA